MSERSRNIIIVVVMAAMATVLAGLVFATPTPEDRVAHLGASIRCPVCQGESIADSPAAMARDMMSLIEERVTAGATDAEIIDELLSSYSGAVLLDPPMAGPTVVLWAAPLVALLAGLGVIYWWRRRPETADEVAVEVIPTLRGRRAIGAVVLVVTIAGVVVAAASLLQGRDGGSGGVAAMDVEDLDQVSNETMEAVIAANTTDPLINGMRLALAERYFEAGDYRAAFPHYLSVAESPGASEVEVVAALVGLGWMAWDGNGEATTAIGLFDQALAIDADSVTARYLKGRVLWCGADSPESAADLLTDVLAGDGLTPESRALIQQDLEALQNGESCG
ncbi:MAG: cytochrome c-type biogenesis protein [Acidimicrobiia bacterium]